MNVIRLGQIRIFLQLILIVMGVIYTSVEAVEIVDITSKDPDRSSTSASRDKLFFAENRNDAVLSGSSLQQQQLLVYNVHDSVPTSSPSGGDGTSAPVDTSPPNNIPVPAPIPVDVPNTAAPIVPTITQAPVPIIPTNQTIAPTNSPPPHSPISTSAPVPSNGTTTAPVPTNTTTSAPVPVTSTAPIVPAPVPIVAPTSVPIVVPTPVTVSPAVVKPTLNPVTRQPISPVVVPTNAPQKQKQSTIMYMIQIIIKTIVWCIIILLSVIVFGACMSHRYRIYTCLRSTYYTISHMIQNMACTIYITTQLQSVPYLSSIYRYFSNLRSSSSSNNTSSRFDVNTILFDNDINEGLLMREREYE